MIIQVDVGSLVNVKFPIAFLLGCNHYSNPGPIVIGYHNNKYHFYCIVDIEEKHQQL